MTDDFTTKQLKFDLNTTHTVSFGAYRLGPDGELYIQHVYRNKDRHWAEWKKLTRLTEEEIKCQAP
jgi:hypothetical protein